MKFYLSRGKSARAFPFPSSFFSLSDLYFYIFLFIFILFFYCIFYCIFIVLFVVLCVAARGGMGVIKHSRCGRGTAGYGKSRLGAKDGDPGKHGEGYVREARDDPRPGLMLREYIFSVQRNTQVQPVYIVHTTHFNYWAM